MLAVLSTIVALAAPPAPPAPPGPKRPPVIAILPAKVEPRLGRPPRSYPVH